MSTRSAGMADLSAIIRDYLTNETGGLPAGVPCDGADSTHRLRLGLPPMTPRCVGPAKQSSADAEPLDAILVALWQCETERGFEHMARKVRELFADHDSEVRS